MSLAPREITLGAMRFNSDSQKLEYWMGSAWMQIQTFTPNLIFQASQYAKGSGHGLVSLTSTYTNGFFVLQNLKQHLRPSL